jgi:hypothetical protein
LVHNSIIWLSLSLLALIGLVLSPFCAALLSADDEAARITSNLIAYIVAHLPYLLALWAARQAVETRRVEGMIVAGAVLLRLSALTLDPVLSDDWRRYRWEASAWAEGKNPYRTTPTAESAADPRIPGRDFSAVYGPALEAAHWAGYRLGIPLWRTAAVAEAFLLCMLWIWMKRTQTPLWRWILVAWSPLHLFEFWGNGHNDAWLVLLLFSSVALQDFLRPASAAVYFALAVMTKWWPILLAPVWFTSSTIRALPWFLLTLAPLIFVLSPSEWIVKVRFTTGFLGGWQNNALLYRLLSDKTQAVAIILGVAAIVAVLRWKRGWGVMESITVFVTAMLAVSANIHPWYLSWFLTFLAATRWNPLPWILANALMPVLYDPVFGWTLNRTWAEDLVLRGYVYVPIIGFAAWSWFRHIRS